MSIVGSPAGGGILGSAREKAVCDREGGQD
jgi:hypothetical protein